MEGMDTQPPSVGKGEGEKPPSLPSTPAPATDKEPSLATHYHVRRGDDTWHVGEVIQRRSNHENGLTEYYVHYKDCESETLVFIIKSHYMYFKKGKQKSVCL